VNHHLFTIDPEVRRMFPELQVGVAVVEGVTVTRQEAGVDRLVEDVLTQIRGALEGRSVASLPRVQAFRQMYRRFGVDPGQFRPSAEALVSRARDPSKRFPRINTVVDLYNVTSAQLQLPMAAYDLACLTPPVGLRFSVAGEQHLGIGADRPATLPAGELVYADASMVLCRAYNYRDADRTKVTEQTSDLVLFVDACGGVERAEVEAALDLVCGRIETLVGGKRTHASVFP
jgi:DNA/RNA-binding domain of Phe-tRNA-synthetase-like protein